MGHVAQADDELVAEGHATANEAGVTALRNDADSAIIAVLHDVADLLCGLWAEDGGGLAMVLAHPVIVERVEVGGGSGGRREGGEDGGGG